MAAAYLLKPIHTGPWQMNGEERQPSSAWLWDGTKLRTLQMSRRTPLPVTTGLLSDLIESPDQWKPHNKKRQGAHHADRAG